MPDDFAIMGAPLSPNIDIIEDHVEWAYDEHITQLGYFVVCAEKDWIIILIFHFCHTYIVLHTSLKAIFCLCKFYFIFLFTLNITGLEPFGVEAYCRGLEHIVADWSRFHQVVTS